MDVRFTIGDDNVITSLSYPKEEKEEKEEKEVPEAAKGNCCCSGKKDDDHIKVKVSGSDVYKAVSNYLRHSQDLQYKIQMAIDKIVTPEILEESIKKVVYDKIFFSYSRKGSLEGEIKELIKKEIEKNVKEELTRKLDDGLLKSVLSTALKKIIQ